MLVLAPDPSLGIAPERVARVRALLEGARQAEGPASGTTIPGVVIALPGGPDGVLDAVVLRPDGILGLVPAAARVTAGSPRPVDVHDAADEELERLLALPEPAVTAPRRALTSADPGPEATRSALVAPVGSFRVLDVADVRRTLDAFRLGEFVPDAGELARAGFPARLEAEVAPSAPAPRAGEAASPVGSAGGSSGGSSGDDPGSANSRTAALPAVPDTPPSIPAARSAPSVPRSGVPSRARRSHPSLPPVPVTEPVPTAGRNPERDGMAGTASFPATGALAIGEPGGRRRLGPPSWILSWRGLAFATVAAFLLSLGVAFGLGRLTGGSSSDTAGPGAGTVTRTVDGAAFTRQDTALDTTCDGHAYGRVVAFVHDNPCVRLERSLWSGTVGGRATFVALATVQMGSPEAAAGLKSLVDTSGTGNIAELVRERHYPGAPSSFTSAGYASRLSGDRVVIAEADTGDPSAGDPASLNRIASAALTLP